MESAGFFITEARRHRGSSIPLCLRGEFPTARTLYARTLYKDNSSSRSAAVSGTASAPRVTVTALRPPPSGVTRTCTPIRSTSAGTWLMTPTCRPVA